MDKDVGVGIIEQTRWGWMVKLFRTKWCWVKFLRVRGRTSLQTHKERTEWHFGLYKVSPGDVHRMQKGWFFEFAYGNPREEDIERLDDDYGRK